MRAPEGQIEAVRAGWILGQQVAQVGGRLVGGGDC
jgi:hypothetical protein